MKRESGAVSRFVWNKAGLGAGLSCCHVIRLCVIWVFSPVVVSASRPRLHYRSFEKDGCQRRRLLAGRSSQTWKTKCSAELLRDFLIIIYYKCHGVVLGLTFWKWITFWGFCRSSPDLFSHEHFCEVSGGHVELQTGAMKTKNLKADVLNFII